MLKLLSSSSSCLQGRVHNLGPNLGLPTGPTESASPFLRVIGSLTGLTQPNSVGRAFFCSDGKDGSDQVAEFEVKKAEAEAESKSSSAIVSTNPRPEDYLTVGLDLQLLVMLK